MCFSVIFFFKQKTAYEMRISDWSSDLCSSDLATDSWHKRWRRPYSICARWSSTVRAARHAARWRGAWRVPGEPFAVRPLGYRGCRSEEHTSELQSLMRISYAVLSLTKKRKT